MIAQLLPALKMTILLGLAIGILFPLGITAIAQLCFPRQASGSLLRNADGHVIGSELLAQSFSSPRYFHPRPSAAGNGYAGEASGGTNLGPTSKKLIEGNESFSGIKQNVLAYRKENGLKEDVLIPVDAVTRSASGLDPHITPNNARLQVSRVARARNLSQESVSRLVENSIERRTFEVLGEPAVNVLLLNRALDQMEESR